jgi:hypothetical protein
MFRQEIESAPGYVQGLVNKIVSNITVECNNVILKYLEEDMVLSLNVRSLVLLSANEAWQPAFAGTIFILLMRIVQRKIFFCRNDPSSINSSETCYTPRFDCLLGQKKFIREN